MPPIVNPIWFDFNSKNLDISLLYNFIPNEKKLKKDTKVAKFNDNKYWDYVPSRMDYYRNLYHIYNAHPNNYSKDFKLLDVGCGLGNILDFFHNVTNKECHGIELQSHLAEKVNKKHTVFNVDALTFKNYKDYNIIYMYRPIDDTTLLQKLLSKISIQASKGCILITNYCEKESKLSLSSKWLQLSSGYYIKHKD